MKKRTRDIIEHNRKERQSEHRFASAMIFLAGAMGIIVGRCSNPKQNIPNVKHGVIVHDSTASFQPGDTIKVILINEKQR